MSVDREVALHVVIGGGLGAANELRVGAGLGGQ